METPPATVEPNDAAPKIETKARTPPPPFLLPLRIAFSICLLAYILAASNAPIQDCDETFNYWEPLHYLTHGSGLQTWEYSPQYSIRSWAYVLIHAVPVKIFSLLGKSRESEFYFLRCILAFVCAATQTRLYAAISRGLHPRVGVLYLIIVTSTTGFFYSSAAFLPSSFAMYTSILGLTAFLDWQGGPKTALGIMWFGIGALLGWPFAGALIIPFVLQDWTFVFVTGDWFETFMRYLDGIVRCLAVLGFQISLDAFFYRELTVVPWRIVMYNVFSGKDRGPDIFGTEPWHFYVRNLILNFNIWYILAMFAAPLLAIESVLLKQRTTKQTFLRTATFISPFYLWFAIFTLQPHKEERFMFPSYPFLALNAAISLHIFLAILNDPSPKNPLQHLPPTIKPLLPIPILLFSVSVSLLRTVSTVTSYNAPLKIYQPLHDTLEFPSISMDLTTICLGKDWYRFPTSFLLPPTFRPHFIKSRFDGLLPGSFHEALPSDGSSLGLFPGTYLTPSGMNDRNEEDLTKYIDVKHCEFLVDSRFESVVATAEEPDYAADLETWEIVACERFLDVGRTGFVGRLFWVPEWVEKLIGEGKARVWGSHCLLKRRGKRYGGK